MSGGSFNYLYTHLGLDNVSLPVTELREMAEMSVSAFESGALIYEELMGWHSKLMAFMTEVDELFGDYGLAEDRKELLRSIEWYFSADYSREQTEESWRKYVAKRDKVKIRTEEDYDNEVAKLKGEGLFIIYETCESHCQQKHVPGWQCRERGEHYMELARIKGSRGEKEMIVCNNDMLITAMRLPVAEKKVNNEWVRFIIVRDHTTPLAECEVVTLGRDGGLSSWPAGFGDEYSNMSLALLK